ncbi:MAG: GNAT family N-acetyltransferase [Candidatus Dependentiae bacterium]|nr:GNAT family N-acetyltransferase [Candidatus Dependentiae bacterium]
MKLLRCLVMLGSFCSLQAQNASDTAQGKPEDWMHEALSSGPSYGRWFATDKQENEVIIEGERLTKDSHILSSEEDIDTLSQVFADSMGPTVEELKAGSLIMRIWLGARNWWDGESQKEHHYRAFYEDMQGSMAGREGTIYYLCTARRPRPAGNKKDFLAAAIFDISDTYPAGTVEAAFLFVKKEAQGRGIGKLTSSAIFKLVPQLKRITLEVLFTNAHAHACYVAGGASPYQATYDELNWPSRFAAWLCQLSYEYIAEKHDTIQTTAKRLKKYPGWRSWLYATIGWAC